MNNDSPLAFYPLSITYDEQQGIMVGRTNGESYAQFPEDAVALLQQLQKGMSLHQAAIWYEQQYNETVDIEDFLMTLQELQFIRDRNDSSEDVQVPISLQWLGYAAFSPVAWITYCMLFGLCFYVMVRFPFLIPSRQSLFFSPFLVLIELALLLFQIPAVLFHEFFHVLAGRRLGLATKITVGHRLGALTLETSLTSLWSVPRRSRYLPLLAGMLADTIVFSVCIITAWLTLNKDGKPSFISAFCIAMAYSTIWRFLWQFSFYLRTDLYYVIATALGCIDLQNITRLHVRNLFFKLIGLTHKLEDETQWHPRDRQIVHWYTPIYLIGYGISIGILLLVGLPVTIQLFRTMLAHLTVVTSTNRGIFLDSVVFLVLNLIPWIVLSVALIRRLKKWKRQR